MHSKNIIHRDLKPENILIKNNIYKLADFGLSRVFNNINFSSHCGTLGYCAPELLMPNNYEPTKCDLWAIGVIIYFPWIIKLDKLKMI